MRKYLFLYMTAALAITFGAGPASAQTLTIQHSFGDGSVADDGQLPYPTLTLGSDGNFYGTTAGGGSDRDGIVYKMTPAGKVTVIHSFRGSGKGDGSDPRAGVIQGTDGNFYGVTQFGGSANQGCIYKTTPAGAATTLHSFGDGSVADDGANPFGGLVQASDGNFYGETSFGGSKNDGVIYKITTGGVLTIVHSFHDGTVTNDGDGGYSALVEGSNGNLYGTAYDGGSADDGAVFEMSLGGTVTILHSFGDGSVADDGQLPYSALIQGANGDFYGTTYHGGSAGEGAVFEMTPSGAVTILHSFGDGSVTNDGTYPYSGLVLGSDGNLYGTTSAGGAAGEGTVYRVTPGGAETILHSFGDGSVTNDGEGPYAGLIEGPVGNFYGATLGGGSAGLGTLFDLDAGLNLSAPAPPTGLMATPGDAEAALSWTGSTGATSYNVYRGTTTGGEAKTPIAKGVTATGYVNTRLVNDKTYYYEVTAVNAAGQSGKSNEASARPQPPPPAPTKLTAAAGDAEVSLRWNGSTGAASYSVYRGTSRTSLSAYLSGIATTGYTDMDVTNGVTYYYEVVAVNSFGASGKSDEASATPVAPPSAPADLTATAGKKIVVLKWSASPGAKSYDIYRGTSSGGESATPIKTGVTAKSYTNTGLTSGVTYYYEVTAVNAGGPSSSSNEAHATAK